jgi:hypothetical protein
MTAELAQGKGARARPARELVQGRRWADLTPRYGSIHGTLEEEEAVAYGDEDEEKICMTCETY